MKFECIHSTVRAIATSSARRITKRLRGIHAAWHFWFAVSFGGESGLREVGLGGTHPLTRRYSAILLRRKFGKLDY
ncbi:DUF3265 domain-containing protein [Vibrio vulnificus]|nr:DUF3265 domain-containing protein [Vibrio vulnificus]EHU4868911.1 DUF3265 domain-containing protein [Vibrio vulnificus]EHV9037667.1 DUF3265 domain-containing protein [Vibrio vulnificus]EIA1324396.1 DUF3265 domain-containing protein [Vibrio vulnificus]EIT7122137.1 DUF3265 domain-containing protein [Vibrio vulnificus]